MEGQQCTLKLPVLEVDVLRYWDGQVKIYRIRVGGMALNLYIYDAIHYIASSILLQDKRRSHCVLCSRIQFDYGLT